MSKGNGLRRHYDRLKPDERFRLDVLAMARGDKTESERLVRSCPRHTYTMTEVGFSGRWHAAIDITALTYSDLARFMDKLDMVDAFRELVPYSRTLMQDAAFDAYLEGHEAGSRHAWAHAGMEGAPPAWPDDGAGGELMEPEEDERDPAMDRDIDELEAKVERHGGFMPEILDRVERSLTAQALAVWQAFASFCVEEMGVEAMRVVRAYYTQADSPEEYAGRLEDLLERAARLGVEADPPSVEGYRGCMDQAWAKIARLGLR
jgi:hypothetical protein